MCHKPNMAKMMLCKTFDHRKYLTHVLGLSPAIQEDGLLENYEMATCASIANHHQRNASTSFFNFLQLLEQFPNQTIMTTANFLFFSSLFFLNVDHSIWVTPEWLGAHNTVTFPRTWIEIKSSNNYDLLTRCTLMVKFIIWVNYKSSNPMPENCCLCKTKNPFNTWEGIILAPRKKLTIRKMA